MPRTCVINSKGCYEKLLAIFRPFSCFLQFLLIFSVAKENMSVLRITVRIMPKLTVIRINYSLTEQTPLFRTD
jgi:hypothetical protein